MKKFNTNPAPKKNRADRFAKVGIVGLAVALTLSVTPLFGIGADAAFDSPSFCIKASGFDTFEGAAGGDGCRAPESVTVPDTITVNWTAPFSRFATGYDMFAIDSASEEARQIGVTGPGNPEGMVYLPTGGKSAGWTLELRSGGTPVARASVLPKDVAEKDDGGWVHGDVSIKFKPMPITVGVGTSIYAQQENATGTPTVEEFGWKVTDQSGAVVDRGTGQTSAGTQADLIRVSKKVVVPNPKKIGEVLPEELPQWQVEYTYRGKAYTTETGSFDHRLSDESMMIVGPTELKLYTLSANGTRLQLRAGQPDSTDRIRAELY